MKYGKLIKPVALTASVSMLALAGCGTSTSGNGASPTSNSAPKVGGSITINASPHGPWVDVFNPFAPGENQNDIVGDIYEPLVQWNNSDGTNKPWLATKWEWSNNNSVLNVTLRNGVKWSDGTAFTNKDVIFTINMLKQHPAADANALWSYIQSIEAVGTDGVKVTLKQPNSTFLYYFTSTYIVPESQWANVDPVTFKDSNPIGTGPYLLKSFSSQQISLKRNPHYWDSPRPYLETVNYPAETSNDSVMMGLASHELDWSSIFSPNLKTSFIGKDPTNNHVSTSSGGFDGLYVNLNQYPFNMPVVRQAISEAVDRKALSTIAESGYSTPATLNGINGAMAGQWSTTADQTKYAATYDAKKAKQMLLSAGFKQSADGMLTTPQGKPFQASLVVAAPFTDFVTMSSQVASQLKAIGIDASVQETSVANYLSKLQSGQFSMAVSWTPSGPNPFFTLNPLMNTKFSAPVGQTAAANYGRYSNDAVQKLSEQFQNTVDATQQKAIIAQLGDIMAEDLPVIPLLDRNAPNEYSSKNIAGWPTDANPYWHTSSDTGPIVVLTQLYVK